MHFQTIRKQQLVILELRGEGHPSVNDGHVGFEEQVEENASEAENEESCWAGDADGRELHHPAEHLDAELVDALEQLAQVALRVVEEVGRDGEPHVPPPPREPILRDDGRELTPFPR